ncbi:SMP-30/gluconolactonase/LRE family protein [Burkholderia sp. Ax-1724]|uniref:SMP-30/gluconolactonase/LRE family protein n=1 Tax=Burkholderia sp. Ax-1724 TaxID=2608336 RepID=UPI00141F9E25|nr:SMP-30/gluconolactonase/LRE family protein [Burkholderia sp. Ax-1724]NIF52291.1 SMP-30/gluconolactonase/LRE family protein [Burkholderia sp. Ax-1724]
MSGDVSAIAFTGQDLQRPECVLATESGALFVADWRGGVTEIRPSGQQVTYLGHAVDGETLKPNGIALQRDGSFLIAHLGAERGGLFRLQRDGSVSTVLRTVDGLDLPPTNFVVADHLGRLWVTVSTRKVPRAAGYRPDVADGFVVLIDERGARIVADGLGYTNECVLDATHHYLYVNETFGRKLSRFRVAEDGSLGQKEVFAEFGAGTYPDGLAQDVEGNFWITSIVSNRVLRVDRNGRSEIYLEDCEPSHLGWVEEAFVNSRMDRPHLDNVRSKVLRNISSLAFGGHDLQTGFLGCLLGDSLATIRMPVAGVPPVHWSFA